VSLATLEPGQARLLDVGDPVPGLDRVLVSLWEDLTSHHSVACPICASEMRPEYGVHARPHGGHCEECGCTLT
jgi:hypothetical protein